MIRSETSALGSRRRRVWRRTAIVTLIVACVAMGAAQATPARAASGATGVHDASEVSCNLQTGLAVTAHAPDIQSSRASSAGNVTYVGPNHQQWVGFRQWLVHWNASKQAWLHSDQNGDGYGDGGPLFQTVVGNDFSYLTPSSWYNTTSKRWESGGWIFPIRYAGHYRVYTEYFWYADAVAPAGKDALYSQIHLIHHAYSNEALRWCSY